MEMEFYLGHGKEGEASRRYVGGGTCIIADSWEPYAREPVGSGQY
jgi:hypothetical protein